MVAAQYTSILNSTCYAAQKGKEGTLQAVVAVSSSSSSSLDDEPPKRQKATNPTVNSDTEQEAQLLMNQGKQPALIVN